MERIATAGVRVWFVSVKLVLLPSIAIGADSRYAILPIEPIGGEFTRAWSINVHGEITGTTTLSPDFPFEAYIYSPPEITALGTLGWYYSNGFAINDNGHVAGQSFLKSSDQHAFLWRDGVMIDLGTLGWDWWSVGNAVNNLDQVTGRSTFEEDNFASHAYLWDDGVMRDLGTLGGEHSEAFGINESTQIVGWADTTTPGARQAFLWDDELMTNLGTLGGTVSKAISINELGQIAGYSHLPGVRHAVVWDSGEMIDVHDRPDWWDSALGGINDLGEMVGSFTPDDWSDPVWALWETPRGPSVLVEDLLPPNHGWALGGVYDINNISQMVGEGVRHNGAERAFILTPVHPTLTLEGPAPGVAGRVNGLRVRGLTPGARVTIVYGTRGGGTLIPNCNLQDNALQIDSPRIAATATADANGVAIIRAFVPEAARNLGDILLQAVVQDECAISQLAVTRFE